MSVPAYSAPQIASRLCEILDTAYRIAADESNDVAIQRLSERAQLRAELLGWLAELRCAANESFEASANADYWRSFGTSTVTRLNGKTSPLRTANFSTAHASAGG